MDTTRPIRVRMAPSPTGHLHVGTARTTLFNWLFARHYGGTFILRIEDTDEARSQDTYARELVEGLSWLGITWDEGPVLNTQGVWEEKGEYGPYKQSNRKAIYRQYLEQLLNEKKAYWCYCTKEELEAVREKQQAAGEAPIYNGACHDLTEAPVGKEPQVIRLRVPHADVTFTDLIRGPITTNTALLGDQVIARNLDAALYNFAVVVDDAAMAISHVIRGEDHISNTPKQLVIFEALGLTPPEYAHLPLNLDAQRKKLSKRTSEVSLLAYRDQGFLPSALINFFALLGWHPSGDQEVFTPEGLISAFTIDRVQKGGAIFDETKLRWLNREHIKQTPVDQLAIMLQSQLPSMDTETLRRYITAEQGKVETLGDIVTNAAWLTAYTMPSVEQLIPKDGTREVTTIVVADAYKTISESTDETYLAVMQDWLTKAGETHGKRHAYWPVRVALSGKEHSADPMTLMTVLGKKASQERLEQVAAYLAA